MPLQFEVGAPVRQVVRVIEGKVVDMAIIDRAVQYQVEYQDEQGEVHSRWFKEAEIEPCAATD